MKMKKLIKIMYFGCLLFAIFTNMCSCGTTKITASITQPKDGSKTQITINTNTPITTDVQPNTNVEFKTTN